MLQWNLLTEAEKRAAILRLADQGMCEALIAAATQLSVEVVRQIIGERKKSAA